MSLLCIDTVDADAVIDPTEDAGGLTLAAVGVSVRRGGRQLLDDVHLSLDRGELVAMAGASGAGKTTLLRVLADLEPPSAGRVVYGPGGQGGEGERAAVGFVPQDDIVHRELTVRSTLRYAAALRLPARMARAERDDMVDELLTELGLGGQAEVRVGALSGGQRKRVSIAVELLRHPDVLLLDEPTSGLDPATAADVMGLLRRLSRQGVAVVLTTHREADIEQCDRLVFLARGGRVVFDGELSAALRHVGGARVSDLYDRLHTVTAPLPPRTERPASSLATAAAAGTPIGAHGCRPAGRSIGIWRQAALLTRRNAEVITHNRLTLAVLLGSPLLVTAMMATLFRSGSFDGGEAGGVGAVQVTFWLAFAGFFFGLTYGLLQVVVERPVLARERFAGLSVTAYVLSKILVLAPVLTAVGAVLLGILRALHRLPDLGWTTMAALLATLVVESLAALTLGLLASAAVRDAAQATLALPMLCFPQVLFAGGVMPVVGMTGPGRFLSTLLANRWGFEGLGRSFGLSGLPAGAAHGGAFTGSIVTCWLVLALGAVTFLMLAAWIIRRTTPRPAA